ncbi:MAG: aromatic amino acid lyase [Solirubrobacteraceae bacterium]
MSGVRGTKPSDAPLMLGADRVRPADVAAVARGRTVALGDEARERMAATRRALEAMIERGDAIYGATTGVGALKTVGVDPSAQPAFNRLLLGAHAVGHGDHVSEEATRATMLVRAAGLAIGAAGVRPDVVDALCAALDAGFTPAVHAIGSVGQADLSQLAEIGLALAGEGPEGERLRAAGLTPLALEPREAHALVNANAFSTGVACLALEGARSAVLAFEESGAVAYEAVLGNVGQLDPVVGALRPYPGHLAALANVRALLGGGALLEGRARPRALQDALAFKGFAQTQGAARDALDVLDAQLELELRSSGDSPVVLLDEDRAISTGNHDAAPVALALDYARLGLAQAVTAAGERIQKLLAPAFTGLPSGLRADPGAAEDGLAVVGHGAASLAAELRLLAAPVTLEQPTSSLAEGIEDRITLAPLGARRLLEQAGLAHRLAAVELVCAAQAVDLRDRVAELGAGTRRLYELTREHVPFTAAGTAPAGDLGALAEALRVRDEVTEDRFAAIAAGDRPLTPAECAGRARQAAALVDLGALDRTGAGEARLLWRDAHSEAWLNTWWEPRDTGYHDHGGSCVGVYVLDGRAWNEPLVVGGPRRAREYGAGDSFAFPGDGIHRMDHAPGAVTVHVYSPPIQSIGHYDLVDGMLHRVAGAPDAPSPPSGALLDAVSGAG